MRPTWVLPQFLVKKRPTRPLHWQQLVEEEVFPMAVAFAVPVGTGAAMTFILAGFCDVCFFLWFPILDAFFSGQRDGTPPKGLPGANLMNDMW